MKRPSTGETAIHLAMKKKDLDMLRLLVDNGGNIDSQNVRMVFSFYTE
jgi:ankyrin repeat protein